MRQGYRTLNDIGICRSDEGTSVDSHFKCSTCLKKMSAGIRKSLA